MREHLESVARQDGVTPEELEMAPMPQALGAIMPLFFELIGARRYAQGVPTPIPPSEIAAWLLLRGIRPNSRLLWFIRNLDTAWLKAMREGGRQ